MVDISIKSIFDAINEFECITSFSVLAHINEKVSYGKFHDNGILLKSMKLGHPLINERERVCNDVDLDNSIFVIVCQWICVVLCVFLLKTEFQKMDADLRGKTRILLYRRKSAFFRARPRPKPYLIILMMNLQNIRSKSLQLVLFHDLGQAAR